MDDVVDTEPVFEGLTPAESDAVGVLVGEPVRELVLVGVDEDVPELVDVGVDDAVMLDVTLEVIDGVPEFDAVFDALAPIESVGVGVTVAELLMLSVLEGVIEGVPVFVGEAVGDGVPV